MKKLLSVSPIILFFLYALLPIGHWVGGMCGYQFTLRNYEWTVIGLTVVSIIFLILLSALKISFNKVNSVFSALLFPISVLSGFSFVSDSSWEFTFFFVLLNCTCSIVMLIKFSKDKVLKIVTAVLSSLLLVLLLLFVFIDLLFQDFGANIVVKSAVSPRKTYTAEVINNDQGALGGSTLVNVRKNKKINLRICEFSKTPIRVYIGVWGEFDRMEISWKDEETLLINQKEYKIKD